MRARRFGSIAALALIAISFETRARADQVEEEVRVRGASGAGGFAASAREGETPRETTDAASLAETMPGVHVRRLGADEGFATLSIRGSGSSQVAVVLAGVPLTGGSDPTVDLGSLPMWPGVRMRVYRTFAPASLGPGSLGGTLALDPPPVGTEPRTEALLAYGSLGTMRMRAADARPLEGGGQIVTAVGGSRSDGEFDFFAPDATGGRYVRRLNAGHAQASALFSFVQPASWAPGRHGAVRATLIAQSRRQELPGTAINPTPLDRLETTRLVPMLELTGDTSGGAWRVRAHGRRDEESLVTGPGSMAIAHQRDAFITAGVAAGWRGNVFERARLDVQLDGSSERYAPGDTPVVPPPAGARRFSTGVGADLDVPLAEKLTASASGRVDAWRDDTPGGATRSHDDVRPTGHVGVEAALGALTLAAHGGATARPPAFLELFGNRGAFLPNADLRTESAWTVDAGARYARRWGDVRLNAGASTFVTFADDLITFVPVGAFGRAKAENIGRARIAGVEGEADLTITRWQLRVVYTGLDTRNEGDGACTPALGACERPPLPGRPAHDLVADALVRLGPTRLRYGLDWVSGIAADLQGTVHVPARVLQSAGVRVDVPGVPGQLSANLEVKNLFDVRVVEYEGVSGRVLLPIGDAWAYPLPGRTAMATARWRL